MAGILAATLLMNSACATRASAGRMKAAQATVTKPAEPDDADGTVLVEYKTPTAVWVLIGIAAASAVAGAITIAAVTIR